MSYYSPPTEEDIESIPLGMPHPPELNIDRCINLPPFKGVLSQIMSQTEEIKGDIFIRSKLKIMATLDIFFKLSDFLLELSFQKHSLTKESKQYTGKWFIFIS